MRLDEWWRELRLAARGLWRARTFSIAAVLTLAMGIAGTTAMFALIRGVLLRPLPVQDEDRLFVSWKQLPSSGFAHYPFGGTEVRGIARASRLLESVAGVTSNGAIRSAIVENSSARYVKIALVTGKFFEVLRAAPLRGRALTSDDDVEGAEHVLVISEGLWRRHYGGTGDVVGRRVRLDDEAFTIVGVMPADLDYPRGVEAWRPTASVSTRGPFGDAAPPKSICWADFARM